MIKLQYVTGYAAFEAIDTRLQALIEGDYEKELAAFSGVAAEQDRIDFCNHCNDLARAYNEMLEQFKVCALKYAVNTKRMEVFTHIFEC